MNRQATRILNAQPSRKEGILCHSWGGVLQDALLLLRCKAVEAVFFATTPRGTEA